jgi:hypothetical protein
MHERITYFVAQPIARRDDGALLADEPVECPSARAAIRLAEQMACTSGYIGAWAFSRTGHPGAGWCEDAEVLRRFGGLADHR